MEVNALGSTCAASIHLHPGWLWRASALIFAGFSGFFAIGVWRNFLIGEEAPNPLNLFVGLAFFFVGIVMVVYVFTTSVRFTADAIERATFLSAKQLPLSKIHGRREYVVQFAKGGRTRYLKLESNDPNFPTLDFSRNYNFDEAFYKWFYSLPDLDARDKEVHKDSNFGLV